MNQEILDVLHRLFPNDQIILNREYASKKNTVALITVNDEIQIVKWFASDKRKEMEKEINILENAPNTLNVPTIIDIDKKHHLIFMNYIKGENLINIIHDSKISFQIKNQLMKILAEWFALFHKVMKKEKIFQLRGDAHIRNFIFSNHKIWGVDFEEATKGNPSKDIAELCVSILLTDPMFTNRKISWCQIFIEYYKNLVSWRLEDFKSFFHDHMELVIERRIESDTINKILIKKNEVINKLLIC
jgi:predicted Ser/Thr protein kinase